MHNWVAVANNARVGNACNATFTIHYHLVLVHGVSAKEHVDTHVPIFQHIQVHYQPLFIKEQSHTVHSTHARGSVASDAANRYAATLDVNAVEVDFQLVDSRVHAHASGKAAPRVPTNTDWCITGLGVTKTTYLPSRR